jgi:CDP-paratose 2-epimerase
MRVLVTGSSGLIGSAAVEFFDALGASTMGIDNNLRADFFGPMGDTTWNRVRLQQSCPSFSHIDLDIRDRGGLFDLAAQHEFDLVVHAAAQPSHDLAARRPFDDFEVNAVGTLNMLEAMRRYWPDSVFIHVSTNKVYGDGPNHIRLMELDTRWDYDDPEFANGIPESFPIDQVLHSLFGASKLAGDILAQEYGRYFGLKTGIFRGGCLTGPRHAGVKLHGFLSYLTMIALQEKPYTIYGYKGKQVRDQIHSHDVISAFWHFAQNPRPGEVYNLGGGKENAASILECVDMIEAKTGKRPELGYTDENRVGDHICYYSDLTKFRADFPDWEIQHSLDDIIDEMISALTERLESD